MATIPAAASRRPVLSAPRSVQALFAASPDEIRARYDAVLQQPDPATPEEAEAWLRAWSALDMAVDEAVARAQFAADGDLDDADAQAETLRWRRDILPTLSTPQTALKERVCAWPDALIPAALAPTIRRWKFEAALYREANIPRYAAVAEHEHAVSQILGGLAPVIDGVALPLDKVAAQLEVADRATRETAWHAMQTAVAAEGEALAAHWKALWELRQQIAAEAGTRDFGEYMWRHYARSYDADALARFRAGIRAAAGQWMPHLMRRRAAALGLESVRPWDTTAPLGGEAEAAMGDLATLQQLGERLLGRVTPEAEALATAMSAAGLRDEAGRPRKGPGAYMNVLPVTGLPLIFGNYGTARRDLETLLHEMGHALHFARSAAYTPWGWAHVPPMEAAEVGSMALETLGLAQLQPGDLPQLTARGIAAWQAAHAERNAVFLLYGLTVDEFQHRVYAHPEGWRLEVADQIWTDVWTSTPDGVDWTGLEAQRPLRWWRQAHPWLYPFYYLDYVVALCGALAIGQVLQQQGADAARTRYLDFLDRGHTEPLAQLFGRLGVDLTFPVAPIQQTVETLCAQIDAQWTLAGVPPVPAPAPAVR